MNTADLSSDILLEHGGIDQSPVLEPDEKLEAMFAEHASPESNQLENPSKLTAGRMVEKNYGCTLDYDLSRQNSYRPDGYSVLSTFNVHNGKPVQGFVSARDAGLQNGGPTNFTQIASDLKTKMPILQIYRPHDPYCTLD